MSSFVIKHNCPEEITQISNIFIDVFMPHANGSFVKVYLYLLRHCGTSDDDKLSVHSMADLFENTEADILRALRYWQKAGVLTIEYGDKEQITSIMLLSLNPTGQDIPQDYAAASETPRAVSVATPPSSMELPVTAPKKVPPLPNYEPAELAVLGEDVEVQEARIIVETMMGTPVTEPYLNLIIYFLSELGFSLELTIQVFETALSKGKKSPRYIEKIGVNWAEKGITTAAQAEIEASNFDTSYNIVKKHTGINRTLAPAERTIIDGWKKYHFSDTILAEACTRTVLNIGKPNLNYTGKILKEWHDEKVTCLADIEKLDRAHKDTNTRPVSNTPSKTLGKGNKFQNFPQRDYSGTEYSSMEKLLLKKAGD